MLFKHWIYCNPFLNAHQINLCFCNTYLRGVSILCSYCAVSNATQFKMYKDIFHTLCNKAKWSVQLIHQFNKAKDQIKTISCLPFTSTKIFDYFQGLRFSVSILLIGQNIFTSLIQDLLSLRQWESYLLIRVVWYACIV